MKIHLYAIIFLTTALAAQQLVVNPDFSELDEKENPSAGNATSPFASYQTWTA